MLLKDQIDLRFIEWALNFTDTVQYKWKIKIKIKQMLDKLGSFRSYAIIEIQILIDVYIHSIGS